MNIREVRGIAKTKGIKTVRMSKAEIIRGIQQNEGNFPCFGTAMEGQCDQWKCAWREDCLPGPATRR